ncbi:uncharacterized protein ColSpa_11084 [Colletotrichum spaethianum]|uniref:Uncharacterized protein n=1 Tax=Colletotrichum spaethianum TaxID=700344 RepID=A0AA37PEN1_9PEZI|nr:uncharacterized protein ColSpa_11084 [Colletotrichum spaethianum]GKT50903.1 hypothetical protein ColSpa_11084 [Colletotrichum spaethianum]
MAHTAVANTRTRPVTTPVVAQHDKYAADNMTRSASAEPTKPTKRKGTHYQLHSSRDGGVDDDDDVYYNMPLSLSPPPP